MENLEQAIQAVKEQFPGMKLLENEPKYHYFDKF